MQPTEAARDKIAAIERIVGADPGGRGIAPLIQEGELLAAARSLSAAKHVGIITGFFIASCNAPETDGPLGAVAIARALASLRIAVTLITCSKTAAVLQAAEDRAFAKFGELRQACVRPMIIFPDSYITEGAESWDEYADKVLRTHKFDHLVSIETSGEAADGKHYNMRGIDISAAVAPMDVLFEAAHRASVPTTGIGDGGNEIGMGKRMDLVKAHVPHGEKIACKTHADNLIVAGVSNWGGHALAASLFLLAQAQDALPSDDANGSALIAVAEESELLDAIIAAGAVDGALQRNVRSVDGLSFEDYSSYLARIHSVVHKG